MKVYQIISNGKEFRVRYTDDFCHRWFGKYNPFWFYHCRAIARDLALPRTFDTEAQAEAEIARIKWQEKEQVEEKKKKWKPVKTIN